MWVEESWVPAFAGMTVEGNWGAVECIRLLTVDGTSTVIEACSWYGSLSRASRGGGSGELGMAGIGTRGTPTLPSPQGGGKITIECEGSRPQGEGKLQLSVRAHSHKEEGSNGNCMHAKVT